MSSRSMDLTVFLTLFIFAQTINGFTVELIHPNSPSNPNRHPSNNRFDWIRQAYNNTRSRAASIQSRLGDSSKLKTDIKADGGGYVMKYSIGTPPFETYGIADTGSDITWTQCEPCTNCFPQSLPIFDPKDSKSYKTAECDSDACSLVGSGTSCSDGDVCQYEVTYGDQSRTFGDVATDVLTIGGSSFKNVVFGCGHQNGGTFSGNTSGIVGLGNSDISIVNQLDEEIDGKFAYCLSSRPDSKSHISFGRDAIVKGAGAVTTPFSIRADQSTFYWLSLESMSVGNKNFPVEKSSSSDVGGRRAGTKQTTAASSNGNIIIDSGTTLTLIPSDLFDSLKSELMNQIPETPIDDPQGYFDLCYSTSDKIAVPKIVAHFSGANVELSPQGSFQEVEEGLSCFTIIPDTDLGISIFGNLSEVDYLVGYDLEAQTVSFKPTDCSKY